MKLEIEDIIQEVSEYAPRKLREIENTFTELKKSSNNKTARLNLIKQIKDFTKIPEVVLFINKDFNAGVIPVFKSSGITDVVKSTVELFKTAPPGSKPVFSGQELKKLDHIAESSKMIAGIYLIIGSRLLKKLTPAEMTAVLLHELGHVYSVTSDIPWAIMQLISSVANIVGWGSVIAKLFLQIPILSSVVFIWILATSFFVKHGISFLDRVGEYKADNYAAKYGYGDELILVMHKLSGEDLKTSKKPSIGNFLKTILKDLVLFLINFIFPSSNTHPTEKKRIKNLEDKIFNEYKKIYHLLREKISNFRSEDKSLLRCGKV